MSTPPVDITNLTPAERLRLIEDLWESLRDNPEQVPLTPAQEAELDRRIAQVEQDDLRGITLDEVIQRIRSRQ